jgi:pyruvate dehydrogenase E1 component beta subunit
MSARLLSYREAINEALRLEMRRDPTVVIMGEDVTGAPQSEDPAHLDAWGGVLGVTKGLVHEFGRERVRDTPITESAFIGDGVGAAATGLRPVAELMFIGFMGVCLDQITNQAAKMRYMFGGKAKMPLVIRTMVGAGFRAAAQHSQMLTPLFTHIPGLKVVCPSTPYDTKGLLVQAIRDNDPVIFCEHKNLYGFEGEVPEALYAIPFGEANVVREGKDATIVTYGQTVHRSVEAAKMLAREGIECDVIDLRTLSPIDMDTVIESVENTGRLVVVDDSNRSCGIGAEILATAAEEMPLTGPPKRVTRPDGAVLPFSLELDRAVQPSREQLAAAVRSVAAQGRQ